MPEALVSLHPGIAFLDVESSGLEPGSHPVEVAVCGDDLAPTSWLVLPDPDWPESAWSEEAEAIHGIPRGRLLREGVPARVVADELDRRVAGLAVHSDAPGFDGEWLDALYRSAGRPRRFRLLDEAQAYAVLAPPDEAGALALLDRWRRACGACDAVYPHVHRAGPDALRMAAVFRMTADPAFAASVEAAARRATP